MNKQQGTRTGLAQGMARAWGRAVVLLLATSALASTCLAQAGSPPSPGASCTVTAMNRTAPLQADHSFVLYNVPGLQGNIGTQPQPQAPYRVRALCSDGAIGETDLVYPRIGEEIVYSGPIHWRTPVPVPVAVRVTAANARLRAGDTTAMTSIGVMENGSQADLTSAASGTGYTSSNPLIARVSESGVATVAATVAPGSTARVIITAQNQGISGSTVLQIGPRGRLQGRVLRADGVSPVAGAQVSVLRAQPRETVASVVADGGGRFQVDDVSVGAFDLLVTDPATGDMGKGVASLREEGESADAEVRLNGQGTVTVRVLAGAGTPLADSPVTFTSLSSFRDVRTLRTDAQGQAVFERAAAGPFSVSSRDAVSSQISAAGGTLAVGGSPLVTLQLQPTGAITGTVRDSQGAAVPGDVQVRLLSARRGMITQMMAGAGAAFRFDGLPLADGPYALDAMQDGRLKARVGNLVLTEGGQTLTQDLVYGPVGMVRGTVSHAGGAPAVDALVTLQSTVGLRFSFSTRTDSGGRYAVDGVPVGAFTLTVVAKNDETGTADGALSADGQTVTLDLRLASAGIVGTVYERDGVTPVGAGVWVRTGGSATQTDAQGRYALSVALPNLYIVEALGPNGHRGRTQVVISTIVPGQPRQADIVFIGRGHVGGVVASPTGEPQAGVTVRFSGSGLFNDIFVTTTDATGRYAFQDMFVGEFSVSATQEFTRRAGVARGRLVRDGETVGADVVLTATGVVRGRVLAPDGVTAVAGAEVALTVNQGGVFSTMTDAAGAYSFPLVPVGDVVVRATNAVDGDRGQSATRLSAMDEQRVLDVRLVGRGLVKVRVVDPDGAAVPNADVRLFSASPFGTFLLSRSDGAGGAQFPGVFTGDFTVSAESGAGVDRLSGSVAGVMQPGRTIEVTLTLDRRPVGSVGGVTRSPVGTPLPGLKVTLRDPLNRTLRDVTSDAQGRFRFDTVEAGVPHDLTAYVDGRIRSRLSVQLADNGEQLQADLTLIGVGKVSGRAFDAQGAALAGAAVTLRHPDGVYGGEWTVTTQSDGAFALTDIPAGRSILRGRSADGRLEGQETVEVRFDADVATRDLMLVDSIVTLPIVLADGNGAALKLMGDGSADDGVSGVFRGDGLQNVRAARLDLVVGGVPVPFINGDGTVGSLTQAGQSLEVDDQHPASGLYVARRIFVPKQGYFARYLEVLENRTDAPIVVGVRITDHFASGRGGSRIVDTSSGDVSLDLGAGTRDRWAVIDDERDGDPFLSTGGSQLPSTAVVFDGPGAAMQAAVAEIAPLGSAQRLGIEWRQVTVPPHGVVTLMHFLSQQLGRAPARAAAERLSQLPPEALEGLSEQDRQSIVNFVLPAGGQSALAPLPSLDGTIKGRVLGGDSATPIRKTRVAVRGDHVLFGRTFDVESDDEGRFELAAHDLGQATAVGVARDRFTLSATHEPTLIAASAQGQFVPGEAVREHDLVFLENGVLRGRVLRHNGGTVGEGKVLLEYRRPGMSGLLSKLEVDIQPGSSFVFPVLPPRDYPLTATITHLQGDSLTGTSAGTAPVVAGQAMTMDVTIQPTGEVGGHVTGPGGQSAVDAEVRLRHLPSGLTYRATRSDSGGNFRLPDVAEGTYEAVALNEANQGLGRRVEVVRDTTTDVSLTIARAVRLTVQVRFARGVPAPDATLWLFANRHVTNAVGEVVLEVPSGELLRFSAAHPGSDRLRTPLNLVLDGNEPAVTRVIELPAAGMIAGEVLRPDGLVPAGGVPVKFRGATGTLEGETLTDAMGLYRSPALPIGAYVVSAEDVETFKFADADAPLPADGDERTVNMRLSDNRIALPAALYDANSFLYDIGRRGQIVKGWRDEEQPHRFEQFIRGGGVALSVDGQPFEGESSARLEVGRRQFAIVQEAPLAGLNVSRKVYVPRGGYFARYLEILENRGATPVTVDVRLRSEHLAQPGNAALRVHATSSGDELLQGSGADRDRWAVLGPSRTGDPMIGTSTPVTEAFVLSAPGAGLPHDRLSFDGGAVALEAGWSAVTVPAGGRRVLMHFAVQQVNPDGARAAAERLVQLPPEAMEGLTEGERAAIANFVVPVDGASALAPLPSLLGQVVGRVTEGDGTSPVPGASVQVRSSHPLFNRLWVSRGNYCQGEETRSLQANVDGNYRLAGRLQDSQSIPVPVGADLAVTIDASGCGRVGHPVTLVLSPTFTGRFNGSSVAMANVRFDTGIVTGSIQSPRDYGVTGGRVTTRVGEFDAGVNVMPGGSFVFPGLPAGSYEFQVEVPHAQGSGLTGGRAGIQVTSGQTVVTDLPLVPTGAVHGIVTTTAGQPLQDLEVSLDGPSAFRRTPTDGAGRFQLTAVPEGVYRLWVRAPVTGAITEEQVTVVADQTSDRVLSLQANGIVTLSVRLARGLPAADAPVRITSAASGDVGRLVGLTDAQGRLSVTVPAGSYTLTVDHPADVGTPHVAQKSVSGTVAAGEHQEPTLVLAPRARLIVTVTDADAGGAPVPGARVALTEPSCGSCRALTTDAQGRAVFGNVWEGNFSATVAAPGGTTARLAGVVDDAADGQDIAKAVSVSAQRSAFGASSFGRERRPYAVSAQAGDVLSVSVVGAVVDAVPEAYLTRVQVYNTERREVARGYGFNASNGYQQASELGDLTAIPVTAAGEQRLVVAPYFDAPNYLGGYRLQVKVNGVAVEPHVPVDAGTVRGRVVRGDGVTPMAGQLVELEGLDALGVRQRARTGADGRYALDELPAGPFLLRLLSDDGQREFARVNLEVLAGQATVADHVLPVQTTIELRVRVNGGATVPAAVPVGIGDVLGQRTALARIEAGQTLSEPVTLTVYGEQGQVSVSHPANGAVAVSAAVAGADGQSRALTLTLSAASLGGLTLDGAGQPLQGAFVEIRPVSGGGGSAAYSDSAGRYVFDVLPVDQEMRLTMTPAGGGAGDSVLLTLVAGQVAQQDLRLGAEAGIAGTVRSSAGDPLAFADVALSMPDGQGGTVERFARTDEQGRYRFDGLPIGRTLTLTASFASPFQTVTQQATLTLSRHGEVAQQDFALDLVGGTLRVRVQGAGGATPADDWCQRVTVATSGGSASRYYVSCVSEWVVFEQVPAGPVTIDGMSGYQTPFGPVSAQIVSGQTTDVTATISIVRGVIQRADGQPAPHASVSVSTDSNSFYGDANEFGQFVLSGVPAGPHRLRAQDQATGLFAEVAFVMSDVTVPVQVDIRLPASGSLSGVLRNQAGQPVPEAMVYVRSSGLDLDQQAMTDASGRWSLPHVALGTVTIAGVHPTGLLVAVAETTLQSPGQAVQVELLFPVSGVVEGTVTEPGGAAVGGAEVQLRLKSPGTAYVDGYRVATTDATGRYRFADIAPGAVLVQANVPADPDRLGLAQGTAVAQSSVTVDVALGNGVRLGARFMDAETGFQIGVDGDGALTPMDPGTWEAVFDGGGPRLAVGGLPFPYLDVARVGEAGRELALGPVQLAGLEVGRRVFVPLTGGHARVLETLTNLGTDPIVVPVALSSRLAGGSPVLVESPAANGGRLAVVQQDDGWPTAGSVGYVLAGAGAVDAPTGVDFSPPLARWGWRLTVAPGQTVRLLSYLAVQPKGQAAAATARARALRDGGVGGQFQGLDGVIPSQIRNFQLP